jgi:hypothetical protein
MRPISGAPKLGQCHPCGLTFLGPWSLSPHRRTKAKVFRDCLGLLKYAIEESDLDEAREYVGLVDRAYRRMRQVYERPSG